MTQPHQAELQHYFNELVKTSHHVVFNGDLDLGHSDVVALPYVFTVTGDLNLHNSQLVDLPYELIVGGDIILGNSKITHFGRYTSVGGDLNLTGTAAAQSELCFSELYVGGDLTLNYASFKTLPPGLTVEGNLDVEGSLLERLPPNLTVGGQMYLRHTKIKTLPEDLVVGDWISIEGTSIDSAKLPVGVAAVKIKNTESPYNYDIIKNPRYIDPTDSTPSTRTCKSGHARRSPTFR